MNKLPLVAMTAGLLGLALAAPASAALSSQDKNFAHEAAQGGLAEVQTAQIIQQRSPSSGVKQFAQTLQQDHTQANQQLQQIAQQQNLTLPDQPTGNQRAEMKTLRGLSGAQMDHQFVDYEVRDHKHDIASFEREARQGKDPALKSFAQQTLPVLRKHLQMAQSLAGGNTH
jgi:putative membrane protein